MAEVNLSTEDITVLGGPSNITLETNIGPVGNRGVFVMYGLFEPNDPRATFITTPQFADLYIVTDPANENYLQMYQYTNQEGTQSWVPQIKLTINFYSANKPVTFINGEAEIKVNIFDLGLFNLRTEFPTLENTRHYFSVQVTASNYNIESLVNSFIGEDHNPAAISVKVNDIEQDPNTDELLLPIILKAAEFDGAGWSSINNKAVAVNLSIFVVDPTEITSALAGL